MRLCKVQRKYRTIPDSQIAVSQLLYLFNSSNPEERRALVSDDFSKSHISVQLRNAGSEEYKDFFDEIQKDINNEFNKLTKTYPELKVQITGSFALMMRLADDISKNQFKSLAIAAVVISLLMMADTWFIAGRCDVDCSKLNSSHFGVWD